MTEFHRLLQRQLKKLLPENAELKEALLPFILAVNESYILFESNRALVERAMRLSSDELYEKNILLQNESEGQKTLITKLKEAISSISSENIEVQDDNLLIIVDLLKDAIDQRKKIEFDLNEARQIAEASLETRKLFLANVSHEIRTPINAISGMASILAESHLSPTQKEYLQAIQVSADGLMIIINDILDTSKMESGKFTLEKIPFSLEQSTSAIRKSMMLKAEEKGIQLIWNIDEAIPHFLLGDPTRLNQVITNLVSNAIKFTHLGFVTMTISLKQKHDNLHLISFSVVDTGIGIETENLQYIFDQFSQEDITITRRYGGTGLGLSISKTLVEMMGGKLLVTSEKEKGTSFLFELELEGSEKEVPIASSLYENKDLSGRSILLVEDNELNRFLAITLLKRWNARVATAINGLEGIQQVRKEKPDLILMDLQMPVMDGLKSTLAIREEFGNTIPIIAITANAMEQEKQNCFASGMTGYISKPFHPEDLYQIILANLQLSNAPINSDLSLFSLDKLATMYDGNSDHIQKTAEIFIRQSESDLLQINIALENHEFDTIKSLAHKMKPNIELLGISSLHNKLPLIEEFSEAKNIVGLKIQIEELNTTIRLVNKDLAVFVRK